MIKWQYFSVKHETSGFSGCLKSIDYNKSIYYKYFLYVIFLIKSGLFLQKEIQYQV